MEEGIEVAAAEEVVEDKDADTETEQLALGSIVLVRTWAMEPKDLNSRPSLHNSNS